MAAHQKFVWQLSMYAALMALACSDARNVAKTPAKVAAAPVNECFAAPLEREYESPLTKCGQGVVSRIGDTLVIRLLGQGLDMHYVNGDECPRYYYRGRIGGSGGTPAFHVLDLHCDVSQGQPWVELVNAVTGDSITIQDRPVMSPDSARFAILGMLPGPYEVSCAGMSTVQVWRMTDTIPVNEFRVETFKCLTAPGWVSIDWHWRSADTISFLRVTIPTDSAHQNLEGRDTTRGLLVHGPAGWVLDAKSKGLLPVH